jgi:hypothetical protein
MLAPDFAALNPGYLLLAVQPTMRRTGRLG